MKFKISGLLIGLLVLLTVSCAPANNEAGVKLEAGQSEDVEQPEAPEGYALVWQDEFDGDEINQENWFFDLGAGGWGKRGLGSSDGVAALAICELALGDGRSEHPA